MDFKASVSWCHAFMHRHDISIRRRTHVAQKLPEAFEEKIVDFQRFVIRQRRLYNFDLNLIFNADQTPVCFDMVANTTLDMKGVKSVNVLTTGAYIV